ncbi:hypothetical protein QTG54_009220 [Skeletonema marinoi]|uniref:Uncharacterized protein n=1 Tax=Skeletonema marinoi TaxID=267567 RepID=A0AAD8Y809_9STRA|nr:hypothetical protein QTG54_009220 [Skeletonema marinoi]
MTSSRSCKNLVLLIYLSISLQFQVASSLSSPSPITSNTDAAMLSSTLTPKIITISETIWRKAASNHSQRIRHLLQPGLTPLEHNFNSGKSKRRQQHYVDDWTALDPVNPIYNFLIEYYGLKGAKGPRRLARWAPDPKLLWDEHCNEMASSIVSSSPSVEKEQVYQAAMKASHGLGGVLLENSSIDDLGGTLHMRGGVPVPIMVEEGNPQEDTEQQLHGVLYNPAVFYNRHLPLNNNNNHDKDDKERKQQLLKTIAPFQWYTSILKQTLNSDPILHCYGLHEWAMQYHPEGADPPPSAKYQSSLNLRVSRQVINDTVERKGVRCTHVDALRFFAPAAGPLNHHGASLQRMDQLRLEQKGCVHAHMDLLKIGLKLQGFIDSELMVDILEVALAARKLDVEASPYDATEYGAGIVPIETNEGRKVYRERQIGLMQRAEPVRQRLLDAYEVFMKIAFDESLLLGSDEFVGGRGKRTPSVVDDNVVMSKSNTGDGPYVAPERLAMAEPGGLPWRKNLIDKS